MIQQGHAHATAELMRHCVEMFFVAAYQKLTYSRFSDSDIEEVIDQENHRGGFLIFKIFIFRQFNLLKRQERLSYSFKTIHMDGACLMRL